MTLPDSRDCCSSRSCCSGAFNTAIDQNSEKRGDMIGGLSEKMRVREARGVRGHEAHNTETGLKATELTFEEDVEMREVVAWLREREMYNETLSDR